MGFHEPYVFNLFQSYILRHLNVSIYMPWKSVEHWPLSHLDRVMSCTVWVQRVEHVSQVLRVGVVELVLHLNYPSSQRSNTVDLRPFSYRGPLFILHLSHKSLFHEMNPKLNMFTFPCCIVGTIGEITGKCWYWYIHNKNSTFSYCVDLCLTIIQNSLNKTLGWKM